MRVAINGFGRIGRLILRAFIESGKKYDFQIVAINDLLKIETALHLLKYDSVHGKVDADIQQKSDSSFLLNGMQIEYLSYRSPSELPWKNIGIDLVLECTGLFTRNEDCEQHINAGAKRVLISAPSHDSYKTVVYGVNCDSIDKSKDFIISNASCTTNCLAPIVKAIHEEIGICSGFVTTIHSYTGDQHTVDMGHKDIRRTRAAACNIIPTSTGATKAIEQIFPDLKGKLSGLSMRVPTPNVSTIDLSFTTEKNTSVDDINNAIIKYADGSLKNILGYTNESLVSSDFNHNPQSAIVDLQLTKVVNGNFAHVVAWYDNEWGFSNRMLDVSQKLLF